MIAQAFRKFTIVGLLSTFMFISSVYLSPDSAFVFIGLSFLINGAGVGFLNGVFSASEELQKFKSAVLRYQVILAIYGVLFFMAGVFVSTRMTTLSAYAIIAVLFPAIPWLYYTIKIVRGLRTIGRVSESRKLRLSALLWPIAPFNLYTYVTFLSSAKKIDAAISSRSTLRQEKAK